MQYSDGILILIGSLELLKEVKTAGDHKAHINRRAQRHSKNKTDQKHKRSTKEVPPWNGQ